MKELLSKLEALKGKIAFYDNGIDDCIKVVKEHLKSHKTRQPIQVTEGEFEADEYGNLKASKGGLCVECYKEANEEDKNE